MASNECIALINNDGKKDKSIPKFAYKVRKIVVAVGTALVIFAVVCGYLSVSVHNLETENFALDDRSYRISDSDIDSNSPADQDWTQKQGLDGRKQGANNYSSEDAEKPIPVKKSQDSTDSSSDEEEVSDSSSAYDDYNLFGSEEGSDFEEHVLHTGGPSYSPPATTTTVPPFSNLKPRYEPPESQEPNFVESPEDTIPPETQRPKFHIFRYEPPESQEPEYVPSESDEDTSAPLNKSDNHSGRHEPPSFQIREHLASETLNNAGEAKNPMTRYEPPESQEPEYDEYSESKEENITHVEIPYHNTTANGSWNDIGIDTNASKEVKNSSYLKDYDDNSQDGSISDIPLFNATDDDENSSSYSADSYNYAGQDQGNVSINSNTTNTRFSPSNTENVTIVWNNTDNSSGSNDSTAIQGSDQSRSTNISAGIASDGDVNATSFVPSIEDGSE